MPIRNWNDSARCNPARIAIPTNVEDLRRIVADPDHYPSPVRAIGSLHSLNASFTTDGTLVLMEKFKHIRVRTDGKVTVGAGVTMLELRDALRPHGAQIEVTPEIGNATAGSVACCGTKDSALGPSGLGQVSSTVTAVGLVDAVGGVSEIRLDDDPDHLRLIRSSYGLCGIVYEVTFSYEALKKIRYDFAWFSLDRLPTLPEMLGPADGFLAFLLPYYRGLLVERRTLVPRSEEHTSELQSLRHLVCRLLLEKKKQHMLLTQ